MKIAFVVVCVLVGITFSIPVEREKRRVFQQICLTSADCEASNHQCVRRNGEGFGYCMSTDSPSDIEDHKDDSTYISIPKSITPDELDSINSQRKRRSTDVSPDQDKYGPSGVETDVDDPEHVRHSLRDLKKEALPCSGSKCESDDSKSLELVEKRNLPEDVPKHRVPRGSTVLQNLKNYEPKPTNDYSDGNDLILPANAGDIMEQSAFQRAIYVKRRDVQDYDAEDEGDNDEEEEDEGEGEGADDNEVDNGDENDSSDDEVLPDDGSITNYLKNLIRSKRSASQENKINSSKRRKRQNDDDDEDDDEYDDEEDEEDDEEDSDEETPDETEQEIESLLDSLSRKKRELPKPTSFVHIGAKNASNIKEIKTSNRYKRNAIDDIADMLNDLERDNDEDDEEDDDEDEEDEDESEEIDEEESDDMRRKKRDYDDDDDDEEDDNDDDGEDESEDDEDDDLYSLLARRKRSLMSNEPDDVPQPIRKRQTDIDEDYDDAEDDGDGDNDDDGDDDEDDEDDNSELYSLISRRKRTAELKKDTTNPISVKKRKADDDEDYDSDEDEDDDDDDDEDDDEEDDQTEDYDENVSKLITLLNRGKRNIKTEAGTDMSMSNLKNVDDTTLKDDFDRTLRSRKKRQDDDEDEDDDDDDDTENDDDDDDDDENDDDDDENDGEDDDDDSPIDESELLTLLSRSKRNADLQDLADLNLALSTNNDNQKQILEGLKKLEKMKNSEDTSGRNYEYADDDDYDEYYDDSDQKKNKQSPVQNAGPLPPNLGTQSAAQVKQPELPIAAGMNWQQLGVTTTVNPTTPANVTEGPKQKRSGGSNSDYYDEQDTGTGAVDELLDEDYDGSAGHTDSEVTQADLKRAIIGILKDAGHKKQIQKRSLDFEIGSSKGSSQGFVKTAEVLEEIDTDANSGYEKWSGWSECSTTCDIGIQERSRKCIDVTHCYSGDSEMRPCMLKPC